MLISLGSEKQGGSHFGHFCHFFVIFSHFLCVNFRGVKKRGRPGISVKIVIFGGCLFQKFVILFSPLFQLFARTL